MASQADKRVGQRLPYALQIRFTAEQQGWLAARAESTGRPVGAIVRQTIDEAIARHHRRLGRLQRRIDVALADDDPELAQELQQQLDDEQA